MVTTRTAELISRMPRWFAAQAVTALQQEQERKRRTENNAALAFLFAVEVKESSFDEWQDTVATFTVSTTASRPL